MKKGEFRDQIRLSPNSDNTTFNAMYQSIRQLCAKKGIVNFSSLKPRIGKRTAFALLLCSKFNSLKTNVKINMMKIIL